MHNDNDDFTFWAFLVCIGFPFLIFAGMLLGAAFTEKDNITKGRNQGIVFCLEKAKQCKVEYDYLKLKENQK
jgi:hypothetical protein